MDWISVTPAWRFFPEWVKDNIRLEVASGEMKTIPAHWFQENLWTDLPFEGSESKSSNLDVIPIVKKMLNLGRFKFGSMQ